MIFGSLVRSFVCYTRKSPTENDLNYKSILKHIDVHECDFSINTRSSVFDSLQIMDSIMLR